jgi:hypothetical protein
LADGLKFVGLDVHVRQTTMAVLDKETGELSRCKLRMEPAKVVEQLAGLSGSVQAVYEAGPTGLQLARLAATQGIDVRVCAPGLIPRAPSDRVKTDARDAERRVDERHQAQARLYHQGRAGPCAAAAGRGGVALPARTADRADLGAAPARGPRPWRSRLPGAASGVFMSAGNDSGYSAASPPVGWRSPAPAERPLLECEPATNPPVMRCQVLEYQAIRAVDSPGSSVRGVPGALGACGQDTPSRDRVVRPCPLTTDAPCQKGRLSRTSASFGAALSRSLSSGSSTGHSTTTSGSSQAMPDSVAGS